MRSVLEIYSDPRRTLLSSFFLCFSLVNQPLYSLAYIFNKSTNSLLMAFTTSFVKFESTLRLELLYSCKLSQFLWKEIQSFLFYSLLPTWAKSLSHALLWCGVGTMIYFSQSGTPTLVPEHSMEGEDNSPTSHWLAAWNSCQ